LKVLPRSSSSGASRFLSPRLKPVIFSCMTKKGGM
jgi:hypothetical protein